MSIESLTKGIDGLRKAVGHDIHYRPLAPTDPGIADLAEHFDGATTDLRNHHFTVFGDLVEDQAEGAGTRVTRWFVDESRTICGWFGVVRGRTVNPVMFLFSEAGSGTFFLTGRGAPSLAVTQPPTVHRVFCTWDVGLGTHVTTHRDQTAKLDLRRVENVDDAVRLLTRLRDSVRAWRAEQPPLALLEQDVRAVLQRKYDELGPDLVSFMASRMI